MEANLIIGRNKVRDYAVSAQIHCHACAGFHFCQASVFRINLQNAWSSTGGIAHWITCAQILQTNEAVCLDVHENALQPSDLNGRLSENHTYESKATAKVRRPIRGLFIAFGEIRK